MRAAVDVLVCGAGPAGSAAALAARRADPSASVLLVDRAAFPRDKVCGDGIGPHAGEVLAELDAEHVLGDDERFAAYRMRGPRGHEVAATSHRPGWVIPRQELDARLVAAATDAGAELATHRVASLRLGAEGVVVDEACTANVVIGADGANSVVARQLGQPRNPAGHRAVALRGYTDEAGGLDELTFDWKSAEGMAYSWAFPLAGGRANVGAIRLTDRLSGGRAALQQEMAHDLPDLYPRADSVKGHTLPLASRRPDPAPAPRALLAGDAASLINALSGEGIYYALASGAMAGHAAVTATDPGAAYRSRLRERFAAHWRHTRAIAALLRLPGPVTSMLITADRDPETLEALLDLTLGDGTVTGRRVRRAGTALARHAAARASPRAAKATRRHGDSALTRRR
jgi:geranylgeranyl reductase family protein